MIDVKQEELLNEALKLVEEAKKKGLVLKIMGAIAIRIHCPSFCQILTKLGRSLSDIDFAAYSNQASDVLKFLKDFGYQEDVRHAFVRADRIMLTNSKTGIRVDVFFDKLDMCHRIDFKDRLDIDHPTVPLSEILLEKMQIVKIAEKDIKDALVLLREHEIGETDDEKINSAYIAKLLSDDWGFYHTVTTNLKRIRDEFLTFLPTKASQVGGPQAGHIT
ncbi:hypothetical protein KEJ32_03670 [Candidatus Bathyarchaeota archaeon]|nr:hypothetical protein [Candidatus Bathyarchaeota archaeon]